MKALILAGGLGTRLRPLSCTRPKTLFPILNKPLLQWIFEKLAKDGITEVILAVNQQTALSIRQKRIPKYGLHVKYSHDPARMQLGTAGPVKKAEKLIGHDESFLVINGDILTNISYAELLKAHKKTNATATIALCKVEDPSRYGVAQITSDNRITQFIEKPPKETAPSKLINAGIYVLNPKIFQYIPPKTSVSMEREIFPQLAQQGTLYGHVTTDMWIDIGKPEEYLQTNKLLLDAINQKHPNTRKYTIKNPTAIDKNVKIGEISTIGPYAVIGKNVTIGKNTQINNTVIFPDTQIAESTSITGTIIGQAATIGKNVKINKGCIIADQAKIKDNISLPPETAVCSAKEVSENILKTKIIC